MKTPLYPEPKQLNLSQINKDILLWWKENAIFEKSISSRPADKVFVFYEGPPSANGMPGIHHVMARAIKDIFCRYKTLQGYRVERKGGWDTHGLPIELAVEKQLGITKEDIGKKISVDDYNHACRTEVMKYTDVWNDLTEKMGYWVDLENPYITYKNEYIESLWWILKELYNKDLLYKGYTIQPYSPAAGTGLSSHELNQPGTYQNVKDTSVVAQFALTLESTEKLSKTANYILPTENLYFLAWTTTPWTLPSNTALAVGKKINYCIVNTFNPYTYQAQTVILAKELMGKYFLEANAELKLEDYKTGDKAIPFQILAEVKGQDLEGLRYEQLLPYTQPTDGDAFRVIIGDFVTTQDGTGIVHIAPSFGADDFRVAKSNGIGSLTLVDKRGKFVDEVTDYAGEFVKEAYLNDAQKETERLKQGRDKYLSVDERLSIKLKESNNAFKVERYEHSYPHCWRTDKPILYYPLDSWFIKVTAVKDRMVELNKTINWKPESTGTGRFGNWLENVNDWNLSRSRFWGTPLPIWRTADGAEEKCIGSIEELSTEIEKAISKGYMTENPLKEEVFDLHRPYVDDIFLVSANGEKMTRETDLIDVWFDSGAMPYAQHQARPNSVGDMAGIFPADFIAEGVDQTRGWFYTLHAISTMLLDSVAYKNVVSNGLVLDKNGNKMSKRLGNAVDPFTTIEKYGSDATRWYLVSNAAPWDNLRFNEEYLAETQRKFFGTLYNTYAFFALYANIDGFEVNSSKKVDVEHLTELDKWIISELQKLIIETEAAYESYEPHRAARAIQDFVGDQLSNWYVRLGRRRFWKGEMTADKQAAYETLHECLSIVAQLMSPVAPFFSDWLYQNLHKSNTSASESVHLSTWPVANNDLIDEKLSHRMASAQTICSMVFALRKKVDIRVRQPLQKILVPVLNPEFLTEIELVKDLIISEVNIKEIEFITDTKGIITKKIKPNFKTLGKKAGAQMKAVAEAITSLTEAQIETLENIGSLDLGLATYDLPLTLEDVEILSEDIPGWLVATQGGITVALDVTITEALELEGNARELINRIQNLRKDMNFEVTDKINIEINVTDNYKKAIEIHQEYIKNETLSKNITLVSNPSEKFVFIEIDEVKIALFISKSHE